MVYLLPNNIHGHGVGGILFVLTLTIFIERPLYYEGLDGGGGGERVCNSLISKN